jgi:hypothetical protein
MTGGGCYACRTRAQLPRRHIHHSARDTRRKSSATAARLLIGHDVAATYIEDSFLEGVDSVVILTGVARRRASSRCDLN